VDVSIAGDEARSVVLRLSRHPDRVATEAKLLATLANLGLPVPDVLAGPATDPDVAETCPFTVLSMLPGQDLQRLSLSSPVGLATAKFLVIEAVARLHALTATVRNTSVAAELPSRDLWAEVRAVLDRGGPWPDEPVFRDAVRQLEPILRAIRTPLVFSNGDYQPGNFLSDGHALTGFVDFESACFEDPHYGFAKYLVYDMDPLNDAGLVEHYLAVNGLSQRDFAPRLAARCLWTLQREIPASGGSPGAQRYCEHVLGLLREALRMLTR